MSTLFQTVISHLKKYCSPKEHLSKPKTIVLECPHHTAQIISEKENIKITVTEKKSRYRQDFFIKPRPGYFDEAGLKILNAFKTKQGILLFYYVKKPCCCIGAALFDHQKPTSLIWRSANPIYHEEEKIYPTDAILEKDHIEIHFGKDNDLFSICFSLNQLLGKCRKNCAVTYQKKEHPFIERCHKNPIIEPIAANDWENCATFNPAAIYLDDKIHFIYRAIGHNGMSVLGYANSHDGIHIDERLPEPIYKPTAPFEFIAHHTPACSTAYISGGNWGGGWGGCEDPRLTQIGDMIYMTYTAFNGAHPPGVALTSISAGDFLNRHWDWTPPILISPHGEIHKNWVLFPEKINEKYAIIHSISPTIQIDYFDGLSPEHDICINSQFSRVERNHCWDSLPRGVGAPPIKTDDGWLIFYHAMDKKDPNKYKLGAMILELNNPSNILYRALQPVLEPKVHYENEGHKFGVIYSCGAVVMNGQLFVYYGGADKVSCVATAPLNTFLKQLKSSQQFKHEPGLTPLDIKKSSLS